MARRTSSSTKWSRSLPRSRDGIDTTIFVPDQCADPVLVRRELDRTSSSGRSNDAGTTVTVVERPASRALIVDRAPWSPHDVDELRWPRDDAGRGRAIEHLPHLLAGEGERHGVRLGDVGVDLDAVAQLAVDLDHHRHGLDREE